MDIQHWIGVIFVLFTVCMLLVSTRTVAAASRQTVIAPKGMVVTPHYLASQAAMRTLGEGGNAVEAAIAAASAIGVVYPHMNSIGGDNFWLIYNAKQDELRALNASGRSGSQATIEYYKSRGFSKIPARGYLAANTVPGVISGWWKAYHYSQETMQGAQKWGSLLEDAIGYAQEGFPVSPSQNKWTRVNINEQDRQFRCLQQFEGFRKTFLKQGGAPYQIGELFKQQSLAKTLKIIAEQGADSFYQGQIAKQIVSEIQANGGVLSLEDFAQHQADWVEPLCVDYRGYKAYNLPPNTQGLASLSILNILNNFSVASMREDSVGYYHLIVEATKQAFADRDKWLTDPDFMDIPIADLLSKQHGAELAKRIDMSKAAQQVKPLDPKGDTVWIGVADQYGNAVSLIQSIYHDFGSAIIPAGTGITLQNRGSFFSLDPAHVNCLMPRKRTFHTLNPAMLFKEENPYLVYGTMGGEGQPQTQAALVTRIVDFGFEVQDAIEAPRWLYGRTWGADSNDLKIEGRISKQVMCELSERGHLVSPVADYTDIMGHAGAILIKSENRMKYGGADPRGDGVALGY